MGIHSEWADASHQIMISTFQPPWTWEEFHNSANNTFSQIRDLGYPAATIIDVNRIGRLPAGNLLNELQYIDSMMPPNVFASVIVGAPYVVSAFMNILTRIRPRAKAITYFANSIDEAKTLIQKRQQELSQEKQP